MGATLPGCELQAFARIVSPKAGEFVAGDTVAVNGFLENMPITPSTKVLVNGVEAVINETDLTWSATVPLNQDAVFNRIVAEAQLLGTTLTRQQVTVIAVDNVTTGVTQEAERVKNALALRINNTGLDQIEPVVQELAGDSLDIGAIITDQNPLLNKECVIDFAGLCIAKATVNAVDVGFGGFGLEASSTGAGSLDTTIGINDLFVEVELTVTDPTTLVALTCGLEFMASAATIQADFDLGPAPGNPHQVDVNLSGGIDFALSQLETRFVSGLCDDPLIGDVVDVIADLLIDDLLATAFNDILRDPDGTGPLDSPIADAVEDTLKGITIGKDVGVAFGAAIDAPIVSIEEDGAGFGLLLDSAVTQPNPLSTAPDLPQSYAVLNEVVPSFAETTPSGQPYGLALGISASAMNQMLAALIEGGLLALDVEEAALPPLIPEPAPLTVGLISILVGPEFRAAGNTSDPVVVQVRPTLAPVLTGKGGPGGEMFEIKLGGLEVSFTLPNDPSFVPLSLNLSLTVGVNLVFNETGLAFDIGTIATDEIDVYVSRNPIEANEEALVTKFKDPALLSLFTGPLSDAIQFPIPSLLGLDLAPVELARVGSWIALYTDLTQIPKTTIQNVVITDTSTPDSRRDSAFDVEEWRHRVSGTSTSTSIEAKLKGFIGADACCTLSDQEATATAAYRVTFDVLAVPNQAWELTLAQSINGSFDLKDDSVLLSDGGGVAEFRNGGLISATYSTTGGASGSFDFKPSRTRVEHAIGSSKSDSYVPFSGANQLTLSGTGNTSVSVLVTFSPRAFSNSNLLLPAVSGDKAGIRFGTQDTIDNHFNIGEYPGVGNRNIADDGHRLDVTLSSTPQ